MKGILASGSVQRFSWPALALLVALSDVGWATVSAACCRTRQRRHRPAAEQRRHVPKIKNGQVKLGRPARNAEGRGRAGREAPCGPPRAPGGNAALGRGRTRSGSIARSAGTTSAGRLATGTYEVVFGQAVERLRLRRLGGRCGGRYRNLAGP